VLPFVSRIAGTAPGNAPVNAPGNAQVNATGSAPTGLGLG